MRTLAGEDIERLKTAIAIDASNFIDSLTPSVANAERNYIKKVLGAVVYENLLDKVEADTLTTDEEALLDEVMLALAPLAYYIGSPIMQVRSSDSGFHTSSGDDKERLTKWMYDEFRTQLLIDGYNALDNLLLYLETNTAADWYGDWSASDAFTTYKSLFVNRAEIFDAHVGIKKSRWLFAQMLPMLGNTESQFILPFLGEDLFNDLKTKFADESADADELIVIGKIQKCIANMAYSKSLLNPNFINEMIVVTATKTENVKSMEVMLPMYNAQVKEHRDYAEAFLNELRTYLNKNASLTVFPLWFNDDDRYEDPTVEDTTLDIDKRTNNSSSGTTFYFG